MVFEDLNTSPYRPAVKASGFGEQRSEQQFEVAEDLPNSRLSLLASSTKHHKSERFRPARSAGAVGGGVGAKGSRLKTR